MNGYYNEFKTSEKYNLSNRNISSTQANEQSFLLAFLEHVLTFIDKFTAIAKNRKVVSAIKMIVSVICFVAFLGILGSLEVGAISGTFAICASLLLVFVELFCIIK